MPMKTLPVLPTYPQLHESHDEAVRTVRRAARRHDWAVYEYRLCVLLAAVLFIAWGVLTKYPEMRPHVQKSRSSAPFTDTGGPR